MKLPDRALSIEVPIRFAHSDPAGIVYYPEYLRMFDDLFDDWMSDTLGLPYSDYLLGSDRMFPLLHMDIDFAVPRRMGDTVSLTLVLTDLGKSSFRYTIIGHDQGQFCLSANFVCCSASRKTGKSTPIPSDVRKPMQDYLDACGGWTLDTLRTEGPGSNR